MNRTARIPAWTTAAAVAALALSGCGPAAPTPTVASPSPTTAPATTASAAPTASAKDSARLVALSLGDLPGWTAGTAPTAGDLISVCGKPTGVTAATTRSAQTAMLTPNGVAVTVRVSEVRPGKAQAALALAQDALTNCPVNETNGLTTSANLVFSTLISPGLGAALVTTNAAHGPAGSRGYFIAPASPDMVVEVSVSGDLLAGGQDALTAFAETVAAAALDKTHGKPVSTPATPAVATPAKPVGGVDAGSNPPGAQTNPDVGPGPGSPPSGTAVVAPPAPAAPTAGGTGVTYGTGPVGGDTAPPP